MNGFLKKAALALSIGAMAIGSYLVSIQLTGNFFPMAADQRLDAEGAARGYLEGRKAPDPHSLPLWR